MADSVCADVKDQTVAYNSTTGSEPVDPTDTSYVVEIRSQRNQSATCRNCVKILKKTQRQTLYSRIREYLVAERNIDVKLKRFKVKSNSAISPFAFLRKLFAALFQHETEAKFTSDELEKLTEYQLGALKESLRNLISEKTKELQQEKLRRIKERQALLGSKQKAKDLETEALVTLRPFLNKHPSLDDLTRVLMF